MKKFCLLLGVAGLTGCMSMPEQPDAAHFISLESEAPPSELVGLWTGGMGPSVSTIEVFETGRGHLCSAYGTGKAVAGVKYSAGQLHTVGFGAADISISGDTLTVDPVDPMYPTYRFHSDQNLDEAANYCKVQLRSG